MKLLGWMHRKLRQNTNETTPKDFPIGQSSLDDLHCYQKGNYGSKPFGRAQRGNYHRNSFTSLESARVDHEDDPEDDITELFHGFLAIGTLGTEQFTSNPATPTFSISVDHIAEKETEVTENELKLINDELEKVLGDDVSSGRNSQVSAGRISYCSAITLSGKPNIESADTCPLQSYLFGSAIGVAETAAPVRKEQRTSLGELFQKTKQADENCATKSEKRVEKETDKSAVHVMKKMLKKRIVHASSKSSTAGTTIDSTTAEKKLHKATL
ncbi:hypothetical protein PHJA_002813800 [Phtheirospermum japonicum]|uniref:LAZY1 n=1 Tax=Phtheirospermum japonicum TaxID=374723 RepID=A0A830D256_9LAMI|nr:hypothetical protein PHJA_002813800 [Phtheirospermum japonicum]